MLELLAAVGKALIYIWLKCGSLCSFELFNLCISLTSSSLVKRLKLLILSKLLWIQLLLGYQNTRRYHHTCRTSCLTRLWSQQYRKCEKVIIMATCSYSSSVCNGYRFLVLLYTVWMTVHVIIWGSNSMEGHSLMHWWFPIKSGGLSVLLFL